jgi:hypothetical protein
MTMAISVTRASLLLAVVLVFLIGCNRAGARIPGISLPFDDTRTGFLAKRTLPVAIEIEPPIDVRQAHYGEKVAGTKWTGCSTDPLWISSASDLVHDRLRQEVAASKLFLPAPDPTARSNKLILKTQIHAFCSQAVGFLFMRIAGISAFDFTLEHNGKVIWQRKIERVVTDADPDYTGSQVTFIEQGMTTLMSDSLRVSLKDLLTQLGAALEGQKLIDRLSP